MCEHSFSPVVFRARYTLQATCTGTGREYLSLAAGYLPPEVRSTECVAERGFAASSESGNTPMVEDPWEDL
ncbi:hypothetical protein A5CBH24_19490 [Alistipes communis]|uniref:Uncharacterized protein n=1 Tax=Alistipes communis TaxID=2585118 RepID=A0A4Y1WWJ0_9BACT|nr:hypothetical protein A5CBH24_19490 [Alistipes communis]